MHVKKNMLRNKIRSTTTGSLTNELTYEVCSARIMFNFYIMPTIIIKAFNYLLPLALNERETILQFLILTLCMRNH